MTFDDEDSDEEALKKFKWSNHTPKGQKTIPIIHKYVLPVAKSPYVKSLLYKGGGSKGKPKGISLSQKVDIWNHLNLSVKFQNHTVNFIVVLNDKIIHNQVQDLIDHLMRNYDMP